MNQITRIFDFRWEMAKTKQTARKTDSQTGKRKPDVITTSSEDEVSPGGKKLVVFLKPARSSPRKRPAGSLARAAGAAPSKKPHPGASSSFTSSEDISWKETGDDDDDGEISFNFKGSPSGTGKDLKADDPGKQLRQPITKKNLKKVQALNSLLWAKRRSDSKGRALTSWWNRTGCRKMANKTKQGWMKKSVRARDANGKILRWAHPGTVALREIRFYQHTQVFLIATSAFQCVVHEIAVNFKADLRWQVTALYYL